MKYCLFALALHLTFIVYSQDAASYFQKANEKYDLKKFKEALILNNKALELSPDNVDYYLLRSNINIFLGKDEEGFADINTAIKVGPGNYKGYARRGYFFYLINETDKSILDYTKAIQIAEQDTTKIQLLINRSSSKLQKRDYNGCLEDCKEVLKMDSLNVGALNNWAMTLNAEGRGEESIKILKKILTIDSTDGYAWMNIGFTLSNMGKYKESIPYFDKTIVLKPEGAYTYNNRGYAKFMLNDLEGALVDINKSIKMNSINSYAYLNRGLVYLAQGKKTKACEDWEQANRLGFKKSYGNKVEELIKANCL